VDPAECTTLAPVPATPSSPLTTLAPWAAAVDPEAPDPAAFRTALTAPMVAEPELEWRPLAPVTPEDSLLPEDPILM